MEKKKCDWATLNMTFEKWAIPPFRHSRPPHRIVGHSQRTRQGRSEKYVPIRTSIVICYEFYIVKIPSLSDILYSANNFFYIEQNFLAKILAK